MVSKAVGAIIAQVHELSREEQLELMSELTTFVAQQNRTSVRRLRLEDLAGIFPYPLVGEDAQAWVSRTRQESDELRGRAMRGTS